MAFPVEIRKLVRHSQQGQCACCNRPIKAVHHRIPESLGGDDSFDNAVGLCAEHHAYYDRLAFEQHIYFNHY